MLSSLSLRALSCLFVLGLGWVDVGLQAQHLSLSSTQLTFTGSYGFDGLRSGGVVSTVSHTVIDPLGNVIVAGSFNGQFQGHPNVGGFDAYVFKFDSNMNVIWQRFIATHQDDIAHGVNVDAAGHIYAYGRTSGFLNGATNRGGADGFVVKLSPDGFLQWTQLIGGSGDDVVSGVDVDVFNQVYYVLTTNSYGGGNFFPSYPTFCSYACYQTVVTGKLDGATGNSIWSVFLHAPAGVESTVFGTITGQSASSIATQNYARTIKVSPAQNGVLYVGFGANYFTFPGLSSLRSTVNANYYHMVVMSLSTIDGSTNWAQLYYGLDNAHDYINAIDADVEGNVYVVGETSGNVDGSYFAGSTDVLVAKISPAGQKLWTVLYGNANSNSGMALTLDGVGGLYVSGRTATAYNQQVGVLDGQPDPWSMVTTGYYSTLWYGFVSKFDVDGSRLWTEIDSATLNNAHGFTFYSYDAPWLSYTSLGVNAANGALYISGVKQGLVSQDGINDVAGLSESDFITPQAYVYKFQQQGNCSLAEFDALMNDINLLLMAL